MMYWHKPWCAKPHDNAFGFRRTGFEFWIHSYSQKANERESPWTWVERLLSAIEPLSTGAVYVNDLEDEGEDRVRPPMEINIMAIEDQGTFDPDNYFKVNQNIALRSEK